MWTWPRASASGRLMTGIVVVCFGEKVVMPAGSKQELRDRFLQILQEAAICFPTGPDTEVTLEAMIEASRLLTEHLEGELQKLREEEAD